MIPPIPKTPEQAWAFHGQLGGVLPAGTRKPWPGLYVVCGHDVEPKTYRVNLLWVHPYGEPDDARPILPGWFYVTKPEALRFVDPRRN